MKNILRKLLYAFLTVFNIFFVKQKKVFVYADNILSGNSEAMLRYLSENSHFLIVCASNLHMDYKNNVHFCSPSFFRVLYEMFTCSVMIDSSEHKIKMHPTRNQLFLQLWHGSPLKFLTPSKYVKNGDYYSKIIYAAEIFKSVLRDMEFQTSDEKMILAGNPCNDYLFLKWKLPSQLDFVGKKIFWMPTYRHWGNISHSSKDIPIIDLSNVSEIDAFLKSVNVKLYIKPHPLQSKDFSDVVDSNKIHNIVLISDAQLVKFNMPLYAFLSNMDALITDYSSVMFDFMLTMRPIGFAIDDFEEYSANEGFCFENPMEYMAGEKILNVPDLKNFIIHVVQGQDAFVEKRVHVNDVVNFYKDGNNCKRCMSMIKDYLN